MTPHDWFVKLHQEPVVYDVAHWLQVQRQYVDECPEARGLLAERLPDTFTQRQVDIICHEEFVDAFNQTLTDSIEWMSEKVNAPGMAEKIYNSGMATGIAKMAYGPVFRTVENVLNNQLEKFQRWCGGAGGDPSDSLHEWDSDSGVAYAQGEGEIDSDPDQHAY